MRYTGNVIVTLVLIGVSFTAVQAQNQKIGFIDSDLILESMPEYAGIEQRLEVMSESWQEEIDRMEREIRRLREEFEAREILFTGEMRAERLEEIERHEVRLEAYVREMYGPDGEYFTRQRELLEPLQRQVFDAVHRVAQRETFDFVFDRAQDVRFLYAGSEWNLTEQVLEELGLDVDREASLRN